MAMPWTGALSLSVNEGPPTYPGSTTRLRARRVRVSNMPTLDGCSTTVQLGKDARALACN